MTAPRRLAVILAADVVGYSRLLGADEAATLDRLRTLRREVIDPLLAEHDGRLFKTTGDGLLAEFSSAVQALPGERPAPMPPELLITSAFLPGTPPRDPAGRIIAATGRAFALAIVTRNGELTPYGRT